MFRFITSERKHYIVPSEEAKKNEFVQYCVPHNIQTLDFANLYTRQKPLKTKSDFGADYIDLVLGQFNNFQGSLKLDTSVQGLYKFILGSLIVWDCWLGLDIKIKYDQENNIDNLAYRTREAFRGMIKKGCDDSAISFSVHVKRNQR